MLWGLIKKKTVINKYVVFDDHIVLKQLVAIDVSSFQGETSRKHEIQVDVDLPPMNNIMVLSETQKVPDSDTKVYHITEVSYGEQDYILVRD